MSYKQDGAVILLRNFSELLHNRTNGDGAVHVSAAEVGLNRVENDQLRFYADNCLFYPFVRKGKRLLVLVYDVNPVAVCAKFFQPGSYSF